jgi:hypothetical protein
VGEEPEAGLLGEPAWAGAINRDSGYRQRKKADAQSGHGCFRQATFLKGMTAVVWVGDYRKSTPGVACDSHTVPGAAAGIDYSRVEGRPSARRAMVTQNLICAPGRHSSRSRRCSHPTSTQRPLIMPDGLPRMQN